MTDSRRRASRRNRGFTLLELGIVIGVAAILAAAIVPDVLETMRNRMAEKAAVDLAVIHDAARLFYIQNTAQGSLRWPGENAPGECRIIAPGNVTRDFLTDGYLTSGAPLGDPVTGQASENFMRNPWREPYEVSLYAPSGALFSPVCQFGVSTNLPRAIADGFISFLPQAACNIGGVIRCPLSAAGLPIPDGFVRCCSFVPKPGASITGPCTTANPTMRCNTTKCWCE